jgi:hypothetical protein
MAEAKFEGITSQALGRVVLGADPEAAWLETLRERYSKEKLSSQVKHSCPKWAFCILCHRGHIRGVRSGCCPAAEKSGSAVYTLRALDLLLSDPSLASNKRELKRLVFGEPGDEEYRTPNDEVEVLLALWGAGAIECRAGVG